MLNFNEFLEQYEEKFPSLNDGGYKPSKVRENLGELLQALDVDDKLMKDDSGSYVFPEETVDFFMDLLSRRSEGEFKELRKTHYYGMSVATKKWLIQGFNEYLKLRGYSGDAIDKQMEDMNLRLRYGLHRNRDDIELMVGSFINDKLEEGKYHNINVAEREAFMGYACKKLYETIQYLENVFFQMREARDEELGDYCEDVMGSYSAMEAVERQELLEAALSRDPQYCQLQEERNRLVAQDTFVYKKLPQYHRISKEMDAIKKDCINDYFPDNYSEVEPMCSKYTPTGLLEEAVRYVEESDRVSARHEKAFMELTPEKKAEMDKKFYELIGGKTE